jgi:hypothetical protein
MLVGTIGTGQSGLAPHIPCQGFVQYEKHLKKGRDLVEKITPPAHCNMFYMKVVYNPEASEVDLLGSAPPYIIPSLIIID